MEPRHKKLLDQVRDAIRLKHYSIRTEEAYVAWIRRYILFHNKRHPTEMGGVEIQTFLTHLAAQEHVASSTQNQALCALLFLYRHVLHIDLDLSTDSVRAKKPKHLPIVLTKERRSNHQPSVRHLPGDGQIAVRQRLAPDGMSAPTRQRPGFCATPDHGPPGQRHARPGNHAPQQPHPLLRNIQHIKCLHEQDLAQRLRCRLLAGCPGTQIPQR